MLAVLGAGSAFAQSNRVPGPQDYAQFSHFITDRNIFDPNRVSHSYNPNQTRRPTPPSRKSAPGLQLVGTMSYEKGYFAFFSGNSSDLSKVVSVGGSVAGYQVTEIGVNAVQLQATNQPQPSRLEVGDGLRQENGKWVLSKAGELPAAGGAPEADAPGSGGSDAAAPAAVPAPAGEMNDVLKRLMEKRQKENQ